MVCLFFISSNVSFGRDFRSNNANHRLVEKVYEVYGTRVVVAIYYGGFLVENDEIIKNPLSMVRLGRKGEGWTAAGEQGAAVPGWDVRVSSPTLLPHPFSRRARKVSRTRQWRVFATPAVITAGRCSSPGGLRASVPVIIVVRTLHPPPPPPPPPARLSAPVARGGCVSCPAGPHPPRPPPSRAELSQKGLPQVVDPACASSLCYPPDGPCYKCRPPPPPPPSYVFSPFPYFVISLFIYVSKLKFRILYIPADRVIAMLRSNIENKFITVLFKNINSMSI